MDKEISLLERGLDLKSAAPDTVFPDSLKEAINLYEENQEMKEKNLNDMIILALESI